MLCDIGKRNAWVFWNCNPMEMCIHCARCALKVHALPKARQSMPVICFLNSWSINQLENFLSNSNCAKKWFQPREEGREGIENEIQNERCHGRRQSNPCVRKKRTNKPRDEDMTNIHRIVNGFWRGTSWLVNFDWILVFRTECLINFSGRKNCVSSTKSVSYLRLTSWSEVW